SEAAQFTDNTDGTGLFTWQTTSDDAGSYTASFDLSNGELSTSGEVQIMIVRAVLPPEWLDFQTEVTVDAGDLIELPLSGTDPGGLGLIISYYSDDISEAAQFTDNTGGTGLFTWQTTPDDAGSYTASFDLSNGELSTSGEVQIIIVGAVLPPEWIEIPETQEIDEGALLEFTVIGMDPNDGSITIQFSSDNLPEATQFTDLGDGTGAFSWQTTNLDAGTYIASFKLIAGELSSEEKIVTIQINDVGQVPEWVEIPEAQEVDEGVLLEFSVIGMDPDGGSISVQYSSDDLPEVAEFNDLGDGTGTFSWQPTSLDAGIYNAGFTLISGNNLSSEERIVTIQVNDVDQPPEWIEEIPAEITGDEGSLIEINMMGMDYDGDEVSISYSSDDLPQTTTFEDIGDGIAVFKWQTNYDDAGVYTATFSLQSNEKSISTTVTITIIDVEQPVEEQQPESEDEQQVEPEVDE
ncbi:MAG: hypothetical protein P9X24_14660, partial [Candidatus Hatepunaea meridiana]|nr:hypothetical protein [Candidatus Hatepunaea meridiana]